MTTPIDPNDSHTLTTIYNEVLDCEAQYITDCLNSAEGLISQDELEGMELDRTLSAVLAVAQAVVPEGFAAYDTREFVLVPFEDIDRYQMSAALAPDEFAADIESWLAPMVERFYQANPDYVSPLDQPATAESEVS